MHAFVKSVVVLVAIVLCCAGTPAAGQPAEEAAFLFAYNPKPGMQAEFNDGYRRHLEWHRENDDPLVWYAWYVVFGKRTGLFLDGTFGIPFEAFDNRVNPPQDRADFARNAAPFADVAFRSAYLLRRDLSTATPLEDVEPTAMIHVQQFTVQAGKEAEFESVLRSLRDALMRADPTPTLTWYELAIGGDQSGYMLMVPRKTWGDNAGAPFTFGASIRSNFEGVKASRLLSSLAATVIHVDSELWMYQSELSYFPSQE